MSDLIKKLFGGSSIPEDLPLELRSILSQMRHERNTFEALTQQASGSIKRAEELEAPVERAYGVFADLEKKLLAFERLAPTLDQLEGRAQQLSEANREVEERAGQAASTVERFEAELEATREELQNVRDEMTDVRELMSAVMAIKQDVTNVLELGEAFRTLRADMDELSTEVRSFGGRFGEIQAKHTAIAKAGDDAEKRIARMESRFGKVTSGLEEAEGRAEALKEVVAPVEELIQRVPETRRDLQTLKALGDYVSQRISQIEQQREVVERYAGQAERLSGLMKQLDRETEKQRENQKFVEQMHERVKEIRSTHVEIEQSTETLVARQKAIDAHAEEQQAAMQALRDGVMEELKNASARFHFDKEGLEALSQRVADLKDAVVDVESRLPDLTAFSFNALAFTASSFCWSTRVSSRIPFAESRGRSRAVCAKFKGTAPYLTYTGAA